MLGFGWAFFLCLKYSEVNIYEALAVADPTKRWVTLC